MVPILTMLQYLGVSGVYRYASNNDESPSVYSSSGIYASTVFIHMSNASIFHRSCSVLVIFIDVIHR